ncbi:MAG TPA: hypothetical protein VFG81_09195 [Anaerolineales bacterium]|jgi:hypothetical protein|nr:hypothetical protein [Anaerolineales bacterium]
MEQNYFPILCGAGFLAVMSLTTVFYWLNKKGWLTISLIALFMFLSISAIGVLFWFYVEKDKQILFLILGLGALAGLSVLSWKVTNRKLVKLLNLKW